MVKTSEYQEQAEKFLKETGTSFKAEFIKNGQHFDDDRTNRDIYRIKLARGRKSFSFRFGQSFRGTTLGEEPTAYDVLACLTKYDPGTFEDFRSEYGYDIDSRKAERTYKAVKKEFAGVNRLFADVIEQLAEIA